MIRLLYRLLIFLIVLFSNGVLAKARQPVLLVPIPGKLMTSLIQKTIDSCGLSGGGTVIFYPGEYLCGSIELRSGITLQFMNGALLKGSADYKDYRNDAFIFGKRVSNITIAGQGVIDGVSCYNPQGEEGFRGPHCIRLVDCSKIRIDGITVKNSANWAINCRNCTDAAVSKVTILGGHDGLHTRFCSRFNVQGCDFRTGDDAFAGNDNRDFQIRDCKVNSSCNGFRLGCLNLLVERCRIWGPGEYVHKIQKRNNMLSAFVHFSPVDEHPKLKSGNWTIRDLEVENVDQFYNYNFTAGLWQTGQPVTTLRFENIKAKGLLTAFSMVGDPDRCLVLRVKNSSFSSREGAPSKPGSFEGAKASSSAFFSANHFTQVSLNRVSLTAPNAMPLVYLDGGNYAGLRKVRFATNRKTPYQVTGVSNAKIKKIYVNDKRLDAADHR